MWLQWWSMFGLWMMARGAELIQPDELILDEHTTLLSVEKCNWDIAGGLITVQTRCYCYTWEGKEKCSIPGPTLVFTNGTEGHVRLANNLQGARALNTHGKPVLEDLMSHDPDVINLHTHGLHVDPAIDDVIDRLVQPGDAPLDYNFTILPIHYPGLHWYHDHWHGTVTYHVHTGLFGAISMTRENDAGIDPNLASMNTRMVILHGLSLNQDSLTDDGYCNCTGYTDWFDGNGTSVTNNPLQVVSFHLTTICDQWCDMYCYQRNVSATPPRQTFSRSDWQNALAASSIVNWDGGVTLFMVNGQVQPTITVGKGEWSRLRIVNADAQGSFLLGFPSNNCKFYYIAADGIFFDSARDMTAAPYYNHLYVSMAGRAEVIFKCTVEGSYPVVQLPTHSNRTIAHALGCNPIYNATATLLTIVVNATDMSNSFNPDTMTFPPKTGYLEDTFNGGEVLNKPACVHYNNATFPDITFTMAPDPQELVNCTHEQFQVGNITVSITGKLFGMNNLYFRHDTPLATLLPNKTYELTLTFFPHPFHHHINPYQLSQPLAYGFLGEQYEWRDVVSPGCNVTHGTVFARTRTLDYIGKVVMHCHFLPHEDRGLMGFYNISDVPCANTNPAPLPPSSTKCGEASSPVFCLSDDIQVKAAAKLNPFQLPVLLVVAMMVYLGKLI